MKLVIPTYFSNDSNVTGKYFVYMFYGLHKTILRIKNLQKEIDSSIFAVVQV